jgi:hypothetical protein
MGIRCTASVWKGGFDGGDLVAWKRIPNHSAGACFSGGGSARKDLTKVDLLLVEKTSPRLTFFS